MRLLIVTQAVDKTDPILGFFHRWIEEFASQCESVLVICLRRGEYDLPKNVSVYSLGKEQGSTRWSYIKNFYTYTWTKRREYDAVFVHMNSEYVVLAGLLWRLLRKRIVLWRNHAKGGAYIRIAARLAHSLCYTSPQAFVAHYRKAVRMPVGIDLSQYQHQRTAAPGTLLSLGRIDPVKRFHLLLAALKLLADQDVACTLDVYGEPTPRREAYLTDLRREFAALEERGIVRYLGSVRHDETPAIYASHEIFVNLTPAGSFDKTIFEAMAAGCLVVTTNSDLKSVLSEGLFIDGDRVEYIAASLKNALFFDRPSAERERATLREYVVTNHSLPELVNRATKLLHTAV